MIFPVENAGIIDVESSKLNFSVSWVGAVEECVSTGLTEAKISVKEEKVKSDVIHIYKVYKVKGSKKTSPPVGKKNKDKDMVGLAIVWQDCIPGIDKRVLSC